MRRVLKRIAVSGGLAAAILVVVGFVLAEAAGFLLTQPDPRGGSPNETAAATRTALRTQIPVSMALWGFSLVAVWEAALFLIRGNPPAKAPKPPPAPDQAEKLLEELMHQADAAMAENPAPGR